MQCISNRDGRLLKRSEVLLSVEEHTFTSGVPSPGRETFQLLFYVVASENNPLQKENEVVVEKFEYLP